MCVCFVFVCVCVRVCVSASASVHAHRIVYAWVKLFLLSCRFKIWQFGFNSAIISSRLEIPTQICFTSTLGFYSDPYSLHVLGSTKVQPAMVAMIDDGRCEPERERRLSVSTQAK